MSRQEWRQAPSLVFLQPKYGWPLRFLWCPCRNCWVGVVLLVQSVDVQLLAARVTVTTRREIRVYDRASPKCSKLRDVAGAAPGEADAGAAVTVVMEETVSSNRGVGFASDHRAGRAQANPVAPDGQAGNARVDAGAAFDDGLGCLLAWVKVPTAFLGDAAEDEAVAMWV